MPALDIEFSMHILFFTSDLVGGGAERVTATLANFWVKTGWRVSVLTYAEPEPGEFALERGVHRLSLGLAAGSRSLSRAVVKNARRVLALRRVLREEQPDVAIGIQSLPSCILALAGRPHRFLAIGTERVYPPSIPLGRVAEIARKLSYGHLDAVVVQTGDAAKWLRRHTSARHAPVIFNPVAIPTTDNVPILDPAGYLDASNKTLLAAGRLVPQKGFDRLLRAFAQLAPVHPDWRLTIAGEGPLRGELEALARHLGITDRVLMPGRVGNMGNWFMAVDAFALTSLFEGFPNVLCEAMAYGLPVVSVDCDTGPRDILTDGVDGLLVKQDDPDALVASMNLVMSDAALRHRLGENAEKIRERLSLLRIAEEWQALFSDLREKRLLR